jgi:hypothetical protein
VIKVLFRAEVVLKEFKVYPNVGPLLFTSDGTTEGLVTVADTIGLYQYAEVVVSALGKPDKQLQIKRIISKTQIIVGPRDFSPRWSAIDLYTVILGATVTQPTQTYDVATISGEGDILSSVFESFPIAALRVYNVDPYGNPYSVDNPLPVVMEGTMTIADVRITAADNDPVPGRIHSSVRISDGVNDLDVNPDGSINVKVSSGPATTQTVISAYNEVTAVPASSLTTILTYTASAVNDTLLQRISVSGDNVAKYQILVNGTPIETKRTYFGGSFNELFEYSIGPQNGLPLGLGDVVTVTVIHTRPMVGTFESTLQVVEIS